MEQNKKFNKNSYLTNFTGFAPAWDAETSKYILDAQNLLFVQYDGEIKVRRNKTTGEKIVIFSDINLVTQPKDFIMVEGGIAFKDNAYNKQKLSFYHFTKVARLQFEQTGFQLMWDMDKEEINGGNN